MTEQEQEQAERITSEYLVAVADARAFSRKVWLNDEGKSCGFLIAIIASEIGKTADAILGNPYCEDALANCDAAIEQIIISGAACSSLFELLIRTRDTLIESGEAGEASAR